MPTFKLIIAYDGTNYKGWQIQPNALTISRVLQDKFSYVFKKNIKIYGSSRTDARVHALGQVAKFYTDLEIDKDKILEVWNKALPQDILIRSLEYCDETFNPRKDAQEKIYCYYLCTTKPLPFISRFVYAPKYNFDIKKLNDALNIFVGTHNFKNFCKFEKDRDINTIKTISMIELNHLKRFNLYQIKIRGNSFLYNMVRRIVGAALDIAANRETIDNLKISLNLKTNQTFNTAPANGLVLHKIYLKN